MLCYETNSISSESNTSGAYIRRQANTPEDTSRRESETKDVTQRVSSQPLGGLFWQKQAASYFNTSHLARNAKKEAGSQVEGASVQGVRVLNPNLQPTHTARL